MHHGRSPRVRQLILYSAAAASALAMTSRASAQINTRVLGLDVSRHNVETNQTSIDQATWNDFYNLENRRFLFHRASRGGTTGEYHPGGGYPAGDTFVSLSQRYDDPNFIAHVNRATNAGMFAGSYHFGRHDVPGNTATDEADHFIQMGGPFMRPGYLPPVYDLEGPELPTSDAQAQYAIDFSNRIYNQMGIRPIMYINGAYTTKLAAASASLKTQLAEAYPILWVARYAFQAPAADPNSPLVQTAHPKDTFSGFYGLWDDNGVTHPWSFWQYASTGRLQSFNNGGSNLDFDAAQGDIEFLKNILVPAIWMNNSSGDWSTLSNWNSGLTPVAPPASPGQLTPTETGPLPTPRLPGAAGSGPTAGSNDTVVLDRTGANVTVTISNGTHNIRKLFMRETLNITGGSLTINYDPTYRADNLANVLHAGPISAQFSGPVSISGGASLTAHTVQVDPAQIFTAGSANLSFNTLTLQRGATPAKLLVNGNVNVTGLNGATAKIATNVAAGSSGVVDLGGGTRIITVADGAAATDLDVLVPIVNGTLTKSGTGNMKLNVGNGLSGVTTINDGILDVTGASQLGASVVANMTVTSSGSAGSGHGGTLRLNNGVSYNLPMTINGGGLNGVSVTAPGITGALDSGGGTNTWAGNISLVGTGVNGTDPTINQISAASGATLVLSGVLSDPGDLGGLAKSGDGDVVLTGASPNTYGERTRVYGGRVILEKDGALGSAGSDSGATGNTFQLSPSNSTIAFRAPGASPGINYATSEWINLDGSGNGSLGQLDNLGGNNTFAGHLGLSGTVDAKIGVSAGSLELSGGIYTRGTAGSRVINKIGGGKLIISGDSNDAPSNSLNGALTGSTVNVNAGEVAVRAPSATVTNLPGVTTWAVNNGGTLSVESGILKTGTLNVAAGGNVVITPTGSGKTIRADAVNNSNVIDLGKSKLIVDYTSTSPAGSWNGSAYTGLIGQVQSGFAGGAWNGVGIRTSQADGVLTTIAIAEASEALGLAPAETTTWRGQVVDGTTVLAAFTWGGDANLDGELNGDDYFAIDSHVTQSGSAFGYANGDFDYNGEINGDDYFIIDSNILQAQASPPMQGLAAVPEPASLGVVVLFGGAFLRRRRGS